MNCSPSSEGHFFNSLRHAAKGTPQIHQLETIPMARSIRKTSETCVRCDFIAKPPTRQEPSLTQLVYATGRCYNCAAPCKGFRLVPRPPVPSYLDVDLHFFIVESLEYVRHSAHVVAVPALGLVRPSEVLDGNAHNLSGSTCPGMQAHTLRRTVGSYSSAYFTLTRPARTA